MSFIPLTTFALDRCQNNSFFGLSPWWHYLNDNSFKKGTCDLVNFRLLPKGADAPSDVPLVLLAVVDDLLRIVALVAIAFVIVGAFKLITSQGNPEDTAKARGTIINALLGMAVAIVAATFVNFIGNKLGG